MTVLMDMLSGTIGAIIIIVVSLGLPFVRKIIFKLFETKVDERANKAISDHNAKNDTKIHTSKVLFELEQQAINNALTTLGHIIYIATKIGGAVGAHIQLKNTLHQHLPYYVEQNKILLEYLAKYKMESIATSVYIPEEIDTLINSTYGEYVKLHQVIALCSDNNDINALNKYFDELFIKIEIDNKKLNQAIREHYNNIKIV